MNLSEIKSHAQKIIETVNKITQLESSLNKLRVNPLSGNETTVCINESLIVSIKKSEIEDLLDAKLDSLEAELQDLRDKISI